MKILCSALLLCLLASCGARTKNNSSTAETTVTTSVRAAGDDSTKIAVDLTQIENVQVIVTANETETAVYLSEPDRATLFEGLAPAVYDTDWNDSGIMVRMVAPDYTLIINYKDRSEDGNDWLMVWKESGRLKFRQKWFLLPEAGQQVVYPLLDAYSGR